MQIVKTLQDKSMKQSLEALEVGVLHNSLESFEKKHVFIWKNSLSLFSEVKFV